MRWSPRLFPLVSALVVFFFTQRAQAEPNYHLVGWLNAFLPGSGEMLLGDYTLGATQATVEVGTFYWGYSLSARSPMTLDGVPEQLPKFKTLISTSGTTSLDKSEQDITKPLYADILQEIGIKYHFVNTFNAYREAAHGAPNIDDTSTLDLFLAPFQQENMVSPWVWAPLVAVAGAVTLDFFLKKNADVSASPPLNSASNYLYGGTYGVVFPFGSAAPEEMFYRGFIQNEAYNMVPSPYFSVTLSTLLFALSHSSSDQPSAAVTGLYEGFMVNKDKGKLSRTIAFHFWADVMAGIEAISLLNLGEHKAPTTVASGIQFDF